MANELPFNIVMVGTFPNGYVAAPQKFADDLAARLKLQSTQSFAVFATGSTEPSSNVGPWLKDGLEWWVWDNDLGRYKPQELNLDSVDDGVIPQNKLAADSVGTLQLIDGSVTDAKLAVSAKYPFRASTSGSGQTIDTAAASFAYNDIQFPLEEIDPNGAYNPVTSLFTAAVPGYYFCSFFMQFDNNSGTPGNAATMQIGTYLADGTSGLNLGVSATTAVASPPGNRWFAGTSGIVSLTTGQTCRLRTEAIDGVGTGKVDISTNCHWSMFLVQQLIP